MSREVRGIGTVTMSREAVMRAAEQGDLVLVRRHPNFTVEALGFVQLEVVKSPWPMVGLGALLAAFVLVPGLALPAILLKAAYGLLWRR